MDLKIRTRHGETRLTISGDMDGAAVAREGWILLDRALSAVGNVTLDLEGVDFIDTSGLLLLAAMFKRFAERGIRAEATHASGQPAQMIEHAGMATALCL